MKKIFSKEKYIERMGYEEYQKSVELFDGKSWIDEFDGQEKYECEKKGYLISDDWCVEVENEN